MIDAVKVRAPDFSPRLDGGGTERPRDRALSLDELAQLFEKIRETETFGGDNVTRPPTPIVPD